MILDLQRVIDATDINKDPFKKVEWVAQYIYDNDVMFAAKVRDSCVNSSKHKGYENFCKVIKSNSNMEIIFDDKYIKIYLSSFNVYTEQIRKRIYELLLINDQV